MESPNSPTVYDNARVLWPVAVCNRTLYGDVGKTYELELQKPLENRLPFLCHLTFTANGHIHGDLVQVGKELFALVIKPFFPVLLKISGRKSGFIRNKGAEFYSLVGSVQMRGS